MVCGLGQWRQHQDELLGTLEAGLGADDGDIATLMGYWIVCWVAVHRDATI